MAGLVEQVHAACGPCSILVNVAGINFARPFAELDYEAWRRVLAVNLDEERKNADAFLSARPHEMPVLFDSKGDAPVAFGVKGMPTSFLIDKSGAIRFTHMGYTSNVDLSYRHEIAQLLSER